MAEPENQTLRVLIEFRNEFRQFKSDVEQRFAHIEQRFVHVDQRFAHVEERLDILNQSFSGMVMGNQYLLGGHSGTLRKCRAAAGRFGTESLKPRRLPGERPLN